MYGTMFRNYFTTVLGFAAGAASYITSTGAKLPTNKNESMNFAAALLLAGLGYAAKDATTGSAPK